MWSFSQSMDAFPDNVKSVVLEGARHRFEAEKESWMKKRRKQLVDNLIFTHTLHYGKNRPYEEEYDSDHLDWWLDIYNELAPKEGVTVEFLVHHYVTTNDLLKRKQVKTTVPAKKLQWIFENRELVTKVVGRISFE